MIEQIKFWKKPKKTALISHPLCFKYVMKEGHPESPERLYVIMNHLKSSGLFHKMKYIKGKEITRIQLARIHSSRYLDYLDSITPESGYYEIEQDTYINQSTLSAMKYSSGSVITAVDLVLNGKVKNAFCAIRPPGHHAESSKAQGFSFINNVAVGVMHAIAEFQLKRVLIIDFDVHHGDGTEEIFQNESRVLLLSSFEFPLYPFNGEEKIENSNNILKIPLKAGTNGQEFRNIVQEQWISKIKSFHPELIFISAGFDGHESDNISHICLNKEDYIWLTEKIVELANKLCEGKLISVLEGGYHLESLIECVPAHISTLIHSNEIISERHKNHE